MHLVVLRVAQHVGVAVAAVELVLRVDVRRMKRQAHLLHPILGGDAERHARLHGALDDRIRQALGAQIEAQVRALVCFIIWNTSRQKPSCSLFFRPDSSCMRNWMASSGGTELHELRQGRLGVGHEILRRHAPHQAGVGLLGGFVGAGNAAALHAAAVDVVPDADRELQPAVVRHLDQPVERGEVALLLLGRDAHHAHVGKPLHVEEIRIARREEAAVLVAEDDDQRVEAVLRQQYRDTAPSRPRRRTGSPNRRGSRCRSRAAPVGHRRLLVRLAHFAERLLRSVPQPTGPRRPESPTSTRDRPSRRPTNTGLPPYCDWRITSTSGTRGSAVFLPTAASPPRPRRRPPLQRAGTFRGRRRAIRPVRKTLPCRQVLPGFAQHHASLPGLATDLARSTRPVRRQRQCEGRRRCPMPAL